MPGRGEGLLTFLTTIFCIGVCVEVTAGTALARTLQCLSDTDDMLRFTLA
jgi:hypothetical protein